MTNTNKQLLNKVLEALWAKEPGERIPMDVVNRQADATLALIQAEKQQLVAEILASLPEKQPLAKKVDGKWVGLLQLNDINNDQAHWRSGANEAIDQVTAVLEGYQKQGKGGE